MNRVAIVDYGLCNIDSVGRAVEVCGGSAYITDDPGNLGNADRIILPGVGSFRDAMANLRSKQLDQAMADQVLGEQVPFLGICLGMQLMAGSGEEVEETPGLGWVDGVVSRLEPTPDDPRVPHVGWNEVQTTRQSPLFEQIPEETDFYFVHSYRMVCANKADILACSDYSGGFVAGVSPRDWVFGVQFHPEKSQRFGLQLLRNFLAI